MLSFAGQDWVGFYDWLGSDYPNHELMMLPDFEVIKDTDDKLKRYTEESLRDKRDSLPDKMFQILAINLYCESVGSVTLKSDSPFDYPLININSFSNDIDADNLHGIILKIKHLTTTTVFRQINARVVPPKLSL
ncbi:unnamed protein product [Brassicogethes aeneus]|uniref:Uncharacterized protein n=1 Tax=Brassicogethes aeneus TaxID=1431903 RepID=A0A9P0FKX7_BRAAE|nr:unnamed protein product [Brassicogethes aeneus]